MSGPGTVHLTFTSGARSGAGFELPPGRFVVGRSTDAPLLLPDAGVSGRHAEIAVEPDGRVFVTDLGSSNGTWVDGERIAGTWLVGDRAKLKFGPVSAELGAPGHRTNRMPTAGRVVAGLVAAAVLVGGGYVLAQALDDNGGSGAGRDSTAAKTTAPPTTPKPKPLTRTERLGLARKATVHVSLPDASGSGWVMGFDHKRPLIVTNAHVVGDATSLDFNSDGEDSHRATVLGVSQCDDLAVVRAVEPLKLPALQIAHRPEVGDAVWIVGFPSTIVDQGPLQQVHTGHVVSVGASFVRHERNLAASYRDLVQVDAVINPGNSGGPIVEEGGGRVVGVATIRSIRPEEPEYYGIASDRLEGVLPYLRDGTSVPGMALGFEEGQKEPRILEVSSAKLKYDGVVSNGGQRLVAIDGKRFDRDAFPNGLANVCDALPELGDGKAETVKYTIRKPDGALVSARVDY